MSSRKIKRAYHYIFWVFLCLFRFTLNRVPYPWAIAFGGTMGKLTYFLVRKERRRALNHLSMAFYSDKSEKEIYQIALAVFENYGKTLAEWLCIGRIIKDFDRYVYFENKKILDDAMALHKGAIAVIAHFGNWELMGGYTSKTAYPVAVLARKVYFSRYDQDVISMRQKLGMQTIYRDAPIKHMLTCLKQKRILGLVVDQDIDSVHGVFVNFFGKPAYTPIAPVRFAQVTGAPVLPVFIIREGLRHKIVVEEPLKLQDTGDAQKDLIANTQAWVSIQEKYIRRYPHLWVWNHRRWKTLPTA